MHTQEWKEAFFREAGLKNPRRQAKVSEAPYYDILNRANTTFSCAYTFNPHIDLVLG